LRFKVTYILSVLLERFEKADDILALIYAVVVDQVGCSVWAVNLVTFDRFFVAYAAFLKHATTIAIS
jgi:hypothetical protein